MSIENTGSGKTVYITDSALDTTPFVIDDAGNTGIGIINPTSTLTVAGTFNVITSATGPSALFVASSGNVGIATTTPDAVLGVFKSSARAFAVRDDSANDIFVVDSSSATNAGLDINAGTSQTGNLLNFFSSGGSYLSGFTAAGGLQMNISSTTALNVQNGLGTSVFNVDSAAGNVQVGTTTPSSTLYVVGTFKVTGTSTSTPFFAIDGNGSVAMGDSTAIASSNVPMGSFVINRGIMCVDNEGTDCDDAARTRGIVYSDGTAVTGIDVAENYPTRDDSLGAGEVVMLDSDLGLICAADDCSKTATGTIPFVARSDPQNSGKKQILGVVSTIPGVQLGGFGSSLYRSYKQVPVALVGRVPVNVTDENGPIKAGDFLMASPGMPGYAMKWTANATSTPTSSPPYQEEGGGGGFVTIIGTALEDFAGTGEEVDIFASDTMDMGNATSTPTSTDPSPLSPPTGGEGKGGGEVKTGAILVFVNLENQKLTAGMGNAGELITIEDNPLSVMPDSDPASTGFRLGGRNDNLFAGTAQRIKFNADAIFAYKLAAENGQWNLDEEGKLVAREIETEKVKISGDKTVGFGRVGAGLLETLIQNENVTDKSLIFVTFLGNLDGRSHYISEKKAGESFKVNVSSALNGDVDFQYWIVDSDLDYQKFVEEQSSSSVIPAMLTGRQAEAGIQAPAVETPSPSLPSSGEGVISGSSTTTLDILPPQTATSTATATGE